jgi:hypothetical protein
MNIPTTTKLADFLSFFAFSYSCITSSCLLLGRGSCFVVSFPICSATASTLLFEGVAVELPLGPFFGVAAAIFLPADKKFGQD